VLVEIDMADVVVAGIGQTPVGEHYDTSLRDLSLSAIEAARFDAGGLRPDALYVGNMLASTASRQAHLGALIADYAGLVGIEASAVEAGGASGGAALRIAYLAVYSGAVDVALVVGVEKFTDVLGPESEAALTIAIDSDYEAVQGLTPNGQAALLMRRYMHDYDVPHEAFAGFPVTAHANGVHNPNAMFRRAINPEAYNRAGTVSDPLNLFDVAPNADGAAAVVLTRQELIPPNYSYPLVCITGSSLVTDRLALHDRKDPLSMSAAQLSVERACRQAGIIPKDVDFFEYHDSYSIMAALSLEAAGFAERGQGWRLAQDGNISLSGSLPVATFGGLKARGNPCGATGVYQVVEATMQLRGMAAESQVKNAQLAMVQSLGGPASTAVVHILSRNN
jgi:acetyl-CoA C-acetyltransferase